MKKHKYIRDIEDTFEDKKNLSEVLFLAKMIKSIQKKTFPGAEFRQHLGDRLRNIHELSQMDDETSKISIFQMWSLVLCLIFVCIGVIGIFGIQKKPLPEGVSHSDPASSSIVAPESMTVPEAMMQDFEGEAGLMKSSGFSADSMQQVPTDAAGLCEYYGGEYINEDSCEFPNGTICLDYNEQSIQGCMLDDGNIQE